MSNVSRGQKKETIARKMLEEEGWICWRTIRLRFLNLDLWGLFDLCGWRKHERKYVQVKSSKVGLGAAAMEAIISTKGVEGISIREFEETTNANESVELWIYEAGRWKGRGKNKKFNKAMWYRFELIDGVLKPIQNV